MAAGLPAADKSMAVPSGWEQKIFCTVLKKHELQYSPAFSLQSLSRRAAALISKF